MKSSQNQMSSSSLIARRLPQHLSLHYALRTRAFFPRGRILARLSTDSPIAAAIRPPICSEARRSGSASR